MKFLERNKQSLWIVLLLATAVSFLLPGPATGETAGRKPVAPTFVQPGNFSARTTPAQTIHGPSVYDQERLLAGHLLRRLGFGPNKKELNAVLKMGRDAYIDMQLNPDSIYDAKAEGKLPALPDDLYEDYDLIRRWFIRMVWSRKQLQEKMTLIWHEHFSVSNQKVGVGGFMYDHEEFLRANCLGNFRDMLIGITKDQAMLIWLDNNYNDGNATDGQGNPIPPNENYAREFLQLFSTGTRLLNIDGTPILDANNVPIPAYTETDVREIARALTGWYVPWPFKHNNAKFGSWMHDEGNKNILGVTLTGRQGEDGRLEVEDVVDIVLQQRQTTVAAFISKILIQKLATETPSPQYVADVATVFRDSGWNIKAAVETILKHPEFYAETTIRSQYKEPIEQFVGAVRALMGKSKGEALIGWTYDAGQLIYYPPSVFSFYPPGNKGALINTALVFVRDRVADEFVRGWSDTLFSPAKLRTKFELNTPEAVVDFLGDRLLMAEMQPELRTEILNYMGGVVSDEKIRGAAWLILVSPDYQRN